MQWNGQVNCRRCGNLLPQPFVRIVERVVETVVIRRDPQCLKKLEEACRLVSEAAEHLQRSEAMQQNVTLLHCISDADVFPTMAEIERSVIAAAYERSNRKPLEAARLLGIGKTMMYRKLREIGKAVA